MRERSIVHLVKETQYINVEHIFCPMCEIWHENNTWCQAPCEIPGWEN